MIYHNALLAIITGMFLFSPSWASHTSTHPLSDDEWSQIQKNLDLIDSMNFMPTLLPTIMRNQDALQLTDQQVAEFRAWRKKNYVPMVNTMNNIIEARIDFKMASLNPGINADELLAMQDNIIALQKQLLNIKLSCRKQLVETFTDEQWESFAFVVSDNPKLSVFLQ